MTISFDSISIDLHTPGQFLKPGRSPAAQGDGPPARILAIGQKLPAGAARANLPVPVADEAEARRLFGAGSMLHLMFRTLRAGNRETEAWALPIEDDDRASFAMGALTLAGRSEAAGPLTLFVGGRPLHLEVAPGEPNLRIAERLAEEINTAGDLPIEASASDGGILLRARHAGRAGNDIDLRFGRAFGEGPPPGLMAGVFPMGGGGANPDIAGALANLGELWFSDIAMAYTDAANLAVLEAELARRFGPGAQLDAHAYAAAAGTHGELTTLGNSRNSPHLTIIGAKGGPSAPWDWAAALAGALAPQAARDPARPPRTLPLAGIVAPALADRFTRQERDLLHHDGISTFQVDEGGRVLIDRAVTLRKIPHALLTDPTFDEPGPQDLSAVKTLTFLRYAVRRHIARRFPRVRLADDGTALGPDQGTVTPAVIRAELVALLRGWARDGRIEHLERLEAGLQVARDPDDPERVVASIPPGIAERYALFAGLACSGPSRKSPAENPGDPEGQA